MRSVLRARPIVCARLSSQAEGGSCAVLTLMPAFPHPRCAAQPSSSMGSLSALHLPVRQIASASAASRMPRLDPERSVFKTAPVDAEAVAEDGTEELRPFAEQYDLDGGGEEVYTETSFNRISASAFDEDVARKLTTRVDEDDIEIKPDGLIYLPEIFYRRRLTHAFGPGGWALMPRGLPKLEAGSKQKFLTREYALFCYGQFVSQASGEQVVNDVMGPSTAVESVRSQAMTRCCKDVGIASELWDVKFINDWKERFAVQVWAEHQLTKNRRQLWRRKDRSAFDYPWKEQGGSPASTNGAATPQGRAEFDPKSVVPAQMKKLAGKSWEEVLESPEGRQYVEWVAQTWEQGELRHEAERALKYISDKAG